jgi:cytochrome c-type biogenesis protein CcmH/NrfG
MDEPPVKSDESYEWVNRIGLELLAPRPKPHKGWPVPLVAGLVAGLIVIVGLFYMGMFQRYFNSRPTQPQTPTLASTAPASESSTPPAGADKLQALEQRASSKPADPASLVELAREYQRRKDWGKAESAYRSALEAGPGNRDAALGLSDVLYQQQKYEESAAVLNKISSEKSR